MVTIHESYGLACLTGRAAPCVWATRRLGYIVREWAMDAGGIQYVTREVVVPRYWQAQKLEREWKEEESHDNQVAAL